MNACTGCGAYFLRLLEQVLPAESNQPWSCHKCLCGGCARGTISVPMVPKVQVASNSWKVVNQRLFATAASLRMGEISGWVRTNHWICWSVMARCAIAENLYLLVLKLPHSETITLPLISYDPLSSKAISISGSVLIGLAGSCIGFLECTTFHA